MELAAPASRVTVEALEPRVLFSYTRFGVIGDYSAGAALADVSNLIKSWNPNFIVTVGDNNYPSGAASTIDQNVGQYFHDYISPYGGGYGAGSAAGNRFWPALGNHDYDTANAAAYFNYFTLPGNERYYNVVQGNVELFVLNSEDPEPDGIRSNSPQAAWLKQKLGESTSRWKIVVLHEAGFSSGEHGDNTIMQWPFQQWGATAVLSGHDHDYERILKNGMPYFVNGLGGGEIRAFSGTTAGSVVRYNADYGAMRVDAFDQLLTFRFYSRTGTLFDTYSVAAPSSAQLTLIPQGDTWKYLDDGSDQGTAWQALGFNDSTWKSGPAQLGYGDGDEVTTISASDPGAPSNYITTYFRRKINVANPAAFSALTLQVLRDDGAVVYVNGSEVFRTVMNAGTVNYQTLARDLIGGSDENAWATTTTLSPGVLQAGPNVIAVELHQGALVTPDASFDLYLSGTLTSAPSAPSAPSALRAMPVADSQIDLTWIDTVTNESGFQIERSSNGTTFWPIATVPANTTAFSDSPLFATTSYWYRVRAFNNGGNSMYSAVAKTTTLAPLTAFPPRPPLFAPSADRKLIDLLL
jgi:hypothetical protein